MNEERENPFSTRQPVFSSFSQVTRALNPAHPLTFSPSHTHQALHVATQGKGGVGESARPVPSPFSLFNPLSHLNAFQGAATAGVGVGSAEAGGTTGVRVGVVRGTRWTKEPGRAPTARNAGEGSPIKSSPRGAGAGGAAGRSDRACARRRPSSGRTVSGRDASRAS